MTTWQPDPRMAEEEGRQRGCTRAVLSTLHFQAPGFYLKQGWEVASRPAILDFTDQETGLNTAEIKGAKAEPQPRQLSYHRPRAGRRRRPFARPGAEPCSRQAFRFRTPSTCAKVSDHHSSGRHVAARCLSLPNALTCPRPANQWKIPASQTWWENSPTSRISSGGSRLRALGPPRLRKVGPFR